MYSQHCSHWCRSLPYPIYLAFTKAANRVQKWTSISLWAIGNRFYFLFFNIESESLCIIYYVYINIRYRYYLHGLYESHDYMYIYIYIYIVRIVYIIYNICIALTLPKGTSTECHWCFCGVPRVLQVKMQMAKSHNDVTKMIDVFSQVVVVFFFWDIPIVKVSEILVLRAHCTWKFWV